MVKSACRFFLFSFIIAMILHASPSVAANFDEMILRANDGDFNAQSYIGHCYLCGLDVDKDDIQARYWYQKVINHPDADAKIVAHASLILGTMYSTGKGGAKCYQTAFNYLKIAAKHGFSDAHIFLGYMYAQGQGVARNYQQALLWWKKADELGHPAAAKYIAGLKQKMPDLKG